MKKILLPLVLLVCLLIGKSSFAASEHEPNNTPSQANSLTLNGSISGSINPAGDIDWFKVTTTSDGLLSATVTPHSSKYTYVAMYDNDGVTQFTSNYSNNSITISQDGLAPGTYYLAVYCFFNTDTLTLYTLSNTLTPAPLTNDVEPNGLYTQADNMNVNGSTTGHVGFYYNHKRDTTDWFKFTTTGDGLVKLNIAVQNNQYVYWQLYDGNGTTQLDNSHYTNTSGSYNVDGLAAGTYYVKIFCFYTNGFAEYTLTDSLFKPSQANDAEPNNKKSQAIKLNLNSTTTGHIGYYYNLVRDTNDWYKVTTNGDGLLRLKLTPANNQYVYVNLYDNNGTTLLYSQYSNNAFQYDVDGLAAGTYYINIHCFYTNGFAPYTLTDSLYKPAQTNDPEPNNSPAQATVFNQNSTVTGHVGYYYNGVRDTADWYKLTTNADGEISFTLTPAHTTYTYVTLYDNDGITVINSNYANAGFTLSTDGLAQGTYYARIYCFYNNTFTPYTLTNNLTTYTNANDAEPNNYASQARTMPANGVVPGHIAFRSNGGTYDEKDWFKINYTGTGDLTVIRTLENEKLNNSIPYVYMNIYADTNSAPIYTQYNNTTTLTASLTGLAQQYYWVEVTPYYSGGNQFDGYNLSATFKQKNIATITLQSVTVGTSCSNGSLSYKCGKSHAPYTVQLYRYGLAYGSPVNVKNTNAFSINNLPPGIYHATAFGDGATGTAFGATTDTTVVPVPTNTSTTGIKKSQVTLKWDSLACIKYYSIQYRVDGTTPWTTVTTTSNKGQYVLKGLTASTTYNWQVASVDTGNKKTAISAYAAGPNFTTTATKESDLSSAISASVYPNPASSSITVTLSGGNGNMIVAILNMAGQVVQQQTAGSDVTSLRMDISRLPAAMYVVRITDSNGSQTLPFEKQ